MSRTLLLTALISLAHAAGVCPPFVQAPAPRADECAHAEITGPSDAMSGERLTFSVSQPRRLGNVLTYSWTVSAGTIVSGQGTPSIVVDTTGVGGVTLEAEVSVGGLPGACTKAAACRVFGAIGCHRPVDTYGDIDFEDEKARLDNLAVELQNSPAALGYVIAYGGRVAREREAERRAERAKDYLAKTRDIEPSRIVTLDGGFREELTVELWVVPSGATPPSVSPSVDPAEVEIIKDKPVPARVGRKG